MTDLAITPKELLYEVSAEFTGVTDFGVSMEDFLSGQAAPPPQGMRIDVAFKGSVSGQRLAGSIEGVDYISIHPDGRVELHIHATVSTSDGANISFFAGGHGFPREDGLLELREHVALSTAHSEYEWVNHLAVWAVGEVNPATGQISVKAYSV